MVKTVIPAKAGIHFNNDMKQPTVYILASKPRGTLYTGVTSDLIKRVWEHKNKFVSGFTKKYNCRYLIYYEWFQYIQDAIRREKQIKGWTRKKKEILISEFNPDWEFLNENVKDL